MTIGVPIMSHVYTESAEYTKPWNSTSGFDFDHITAVEMSFESAPVSEIVSKSDHPRQKKITSGRFSRYGGSQPLGF